MNLKLRKVPLRSLLVVPFVLQILTAVGLVGYFSFRNGQQAVNNLALQLRSELAERIQQELRTYIETPFAINEINAGALSRGSLNLTDPESAYLIWQQVVTYPETNLVYCGAELDGEFLGVGRSVNDKNRFNVQISNRSTDFYFHYYDLDDRGNPGNLEDIDDRPYDPRKRPWYIAAKEKREATWSEIYIDFDEEVPVITASKPVYDETSGELIGVCATDFLLSLELNQFLSNLKVGQTGETFIIERSGRLVSSSTFSEESLLIENQDSAERLLATASQNELVSATARYLNEQFESLDNIQEIESTNFMLNGDRQYVQVVPFIDPRGLDWLIVVSVPEADFMAEITASTQNSILLCLTALGIATILGILTANRIVEPIAKLNQAARSIENGQLEQTVEVQGINEIEDLAAAFNQMAAQLKSSFSALENSKVELEKRVEERTQEIAQANQEISDLYEQLKAENIRMGAELDVARRLQEMILPKSEELSQITELDIAGFMKPADEVGGDYYDILQQNGKIKIGIGDVTGHGLQSGVLMLMLQTAIRTLTNHDESDPVAFLTTLNQTIRDNIQRMKLDKSLTLCLIDYEDGKLTITGQHESVFVIRKEGKIEEIDTIDLGFPIGLTEDIQIFVQEVSLSLNSGDVVVLYTDGIPDAVNQAQQFYGLDRLARVVHQNIHLSAHEIQQAVIQDVHQFVGSARLWDDLTLLIFKRK